MAKTILVPIDFSIESLNTLKLALKQHQGEQVDVILMCSEYTTSSITELLFYSPGKIIRSLMNPSFDDALQIIKNSHESSIGSIRIELFSGLNTQAFKNFIEANNVDKVYTPANYRLLLTKNSFDPIPLIKKSKVLLEEIAWDPGNKALEDGLNQLFN